MCHTNIVHSFWSQPNGLGPEISGVPDERGQKSGQKSVQKWAQKSMFRMCLFLQFLAKNGQFRTSLSISHKKMAIFSFLGGPQDRKNGLFLGCQKVAFLHIFPCRPLDVVKQRRTAKNEMGGFDKGVFLSFFGHFLMIF